jgi:cysteine dioxygenase
MNLLQTRFALDDFILQMMRISPAQLHLEQLYDWVSRLDLKADILKPHIAFCSEHYQRRLLCRTTRFDLLVLCWEPGQASTIHDHTDSLNVTRVYQGQLTSREFVVDRPSKPSSHFNQSAVEAMPHLTRETQLGRTDLVTVERHQVHQLANTADEPLITLHVYARPLHHITVYCPASGKTEQMPVPLNFDEANA